LRTDAEIFIYSVKKKEHQHGIMRAEIKKRERFIKTAIRLNRELYRERQVILCE
jgi:hypothetical protein